MKAVVFAAAAALLGAVHADDTTWESWSEDPDTKTPEAKVPEKEKAAETWSEWATTTEKVPEVKTTPYDPNWAEWSTTGKYVDPTSKTSSEWAEWSTTSKVVDPTTKKSSEWAQWSSTSKAVDPSSKTSTGWADWRSTSSKPLVDTKTTGWNDWKTSSDPAKVTSKPATWEGWQSKPVVKSTRTEYVTVTVYDPEWEEWKSTSSKPAVNTKTETWANWESNGCQVAVSYGEPVWKPTPDAKVNTATWSEWASTSAPVKVVVSSTWADWASTSAPAKPVVSSTWADWASTKSQEQGNKFYAASSTKAAEWSAPTSGAMTGVKGDKYGMTWTPYDANSNCKSQDVVDADMKALAALGFGSVRVYSTDCKTLEYVGAACKKYGLKIILGVFISETGISGAQPQVDAIVAWKQWDLVELIVVGNEAVFGNRCDAQTLLGFIISSKTAFKSAGYKGYVSTTEELSIWQSYGSAWCDAVDVVTANLYAFFNPNTKAEDAGKFIQAQLTDLAKICPGKQVYAMECGWPSAGQCNGVACPSPENQAIAIKSIQAAVGSKIVYFSYENEAWKKPGQFGVEQYWGAAKVFGGNQWSSWQ